MGKDLKGEELGKGIRQNQNGRYEARYIDRFGTEFHIGEPKTFSSVRTVPMNSLCESALKKQMRLLYFRRDSAEKYDRGEKKELYRQQEIDEYWIVDWHQKQVEIINK